MNVRKRTLGTTKPRARRSRTLPAEARIDDLMTAAAALFIAKGIEPTTVDDIVIRAGVAKGTFYHYFATKSDVILALRERFIQEFIKRVDVGMKSSPAGDFSAQLGGWIEGAVEVLLNNIALHDVVFHNFLPTHRQSKEKDLVIEQLVSMLQAGVAAGAWQIRNTRAAALILFDGMHGVVDDAIASGRRDPQVLCRVLHELFLSMLTGQLCPEISADESN